MLLVRVSTGRLSASRAMAGYRPSGVSTQYASAKRAFRPAAQSAELGAPGSPKPSSSSAPASAASYA